MSETETDTQTPVVKKNKGGRPRKGAAPPAVAGPSFSDEQFNTLIQVLAAKTPENAQGGMDLAAIKTLLEGTAQVSAQAMQKAMKPENNEHPGKSVYSYPEGDVAHPRPVLPYEFWWNNYPCHMFPETEHWRELELMGQVQPGEYTAIRRDGSLMAVSVVAERNANGTITKLSVTFPVTREDKYLIPPKAVVLYQLAHPGHPRQRFVEAMTEHLALMMGTDTPVGVGATATPIGV